MMLNEWPTDLGWLILATIPPDRSQHNRGAGSIETDQELNRGARLINGLKQFCRIATHYEKRDAAYCYELIPAFVSWVN